MSEVDTRNDFLIGASTHTVAPLIPISIDSREQGMRTAAYILLLSDGLPGDRDITFEEVLDAIRRV